MPHQIVNITVDIAKLPEVLAGLRREMANALRREAEGEPPFVQRKLEAIAASFEVGETEIPSDPNGSDDST